MTPPAQNGEVHVRPAGTGDEDAVLAMYEWLLAPPGRRPATWDKDGRSARALAQAIASPESAVLVAEGGTGLVGLCTAYIDLESVRFGRRCWVEDLAVHPDHRSQGIGARLLEAAREWARGRGATHLELDTALDRTDAQRFYDRERPLAKSYCYTWAL